MKFLRLIFALLFIVAPAFAQERTFPPATQAEVNAGLIHNKYVSPDTLAGRIGFPLGTNYGVATELYIAFGGVGNGTSPGTPAGNFFGLNSGSGNITNAVLNIGSGQYATDTTVNSLSNLMVLGAGSNSTIYSTSHSSQIWKLSGKVEIDNLTMFDTNSALSTSIRFPLAPLNTSPTNLSLVLSSNLFGGWSDVIFAQQGSGTNQINLAASSCTFTSKWDTAVFLNFSQGATGVNAVGFTNCNFVVNGDTNFYAAMNDTGAHCVHVAYWPGTYNFVDCSFTCLNGGGDPGTNTWVQGSYGIQAEGTNVIVNVWGFQNFNLTSTNGPVYYLYANSNAVINYHLPAGFSLPATNWVATNGGVINFY